MVHVLSRGFPARPSIQREYFELTTIPAPSDSHISHPVSPVLRYPANQPPSHKPPQFRKSQLHRQYTSLLRSTPLLLIFQHNNLKSNEWMSIRRELSAALTTVDQAALATDPTTAALHANNIKLQIVQTGILAAALRVVEFFDPSSIPQTTENKVRTATDPAINTSRSLPDARPLPDSPAFTHALSRTAHRLARASGRTHGLEPLLSGPLALLTFPAVSPAHLAAALSILAPSPAFPAPRRKANPAYHEPAVQQGVQKLMLLGARVEGQAFDGEEVRWVGGIEGGIGGLRVRLVHMLQGVGGGVTNVLEGAGRSLYFAVEGRRGMLEEEEKKEKGGEEKVG
ncbi:hypothetical protein M501DRAFT_1008315 [Patellaria atrata CBS 101060]|uniref:Uncharacterized protein n=1 Tax=Patellaria atrata CBS 101060 TaxID=1346257 RepID=A0A9P4SIF1_9PEZI|nr:hypothetical protein M501DRAFT_1008315 [Patellaria atrata CBS 101060]